MTTEKIRAEITELFKASNVGNTSLCFAVLQIIDKYASEECDNDCEHCAYLECPKEPCEDAISREDAIKAQCEVCDICGNTQYTKCQYFMQGCNEVKCLRDLPSVTPKEPKSCEKCLYAEETDGSHCYECVKGESKFKSQESEE